MTITGRVARGWLSRITPGPWDAEQDPVEPEVDVRNDAGDLVATVSVHHHENAEPIRALPELLQDYVTVTGELVAVATALRGAGVDEDGSAGVQALQVYRMNAVDRMTDLQRHLTAQSAHLADTDKALKAAEGRLQQVRDLLAEWGRRDLSDDASTLYRELAGRLMASTTPATNVARPDPAEHLVCPVCGHEAFTDAGDPGTVRTWHCTVGHHGEFRGGVLEPADDDANDPRIAGSRKLTAEAWGADG